MWYTVSVSHYHFLRCSIQLSPTETVTHYTFSLFFSRIYSKFQLFYFFHLISCSFVLTRSVVLICGVVLTRDFVLMCGVVLIYGTTLTCSVVLTCCVVLVCSEQYSTILSVVNRGCQCLILRAGLYPEFLPSLCTFPLYVTSCSVTTIQHGRQ